MNNNNNLRTIIGDFQAVAELIIDKARERCYPDGWHWLTEATLEVDRVRIYVDSKNNYQVVRFKDIEIKFMGWRLTTKIEIDTLLSDTDFNNFTQELHEFYDEDFLTNNDDKYLLKMKQDRIKEIARLEKRIEELKSEQS